jgi:outer membrane protein TolC
MQEILGLQQERAERLLTLSQENYASGFLLQADLLSSRLLTAEVRLNLQSLRENQNKALLSLRTITGVSDLRVEDLILPVENEGEGEEEGSAAYRLADGNIPPNERGELHTDRLLTQAAESNFDLRLLALNHQAAQHRLNIERSRYYFKPDLGLYLRLSYRDPDLPFMPSSWPHDNVINFSATLGIRSLLFDGGTQSARIRREEENLVQAQIALDQGLSDLGEYIERTLLELEFSGLRQDYLRLQIEEARGQLTQAENAQAAGYGEEHASLLRELTLNTRRLALLQEQLSARILRIQLEAVIIG